MIINKEGKKRARTIIHSRDNNNYKHIAILIDDQMNIYILLTEHEAKEIAHPTLLYLFGTN